VLRESSIYFYTEFLMLGCSNGGEAEIDEKVMGEHCPFTG
jgi:hypothetical protein